VIVAALVALGYLPEIRYSSRLVGGCGWLPVLSRKEPGHQLPSRVPGFLL
jgi:hypothetical protein